MKRNGCTDKQSAYIPAVDDPSGPAPTGRLLEQSEAAVTGIEPEGERHECSAQHDAKQDTEQLTDVHHVEHDHQQEIPEQSAREIEQILGLQAVELDLAADALVDVVSRHSFRGKKSAGRFPR